MRPRRIPITFISLILFNLFTYHLALAEATPDVHFVPTPQYVVNEMLELAEVKAGDIVYDLGCGDGRFVITAAKKYGAKGVGIDIDPQRIRESQENALKAGVWEKVKFIEGDLFKSDIHEATVVALYLLPELNLRLRPKLFKELRPGTRVVSHNFDMDDWKPDAEGELGDSSYYLWIIPAPVGGLWEIKAAALEAKEPFHLEITQRFQFVTIRTLSREKDVTITVTDARLKGDKISFLLRKNYRHGPLIDLYFQGKVVGDRIVGEVVVEGGPNEGTHNWSASRLR